MDDTPVNIYVTNTFLCLEPEVGKKLLPLYPEFLSDEEKARFELHLEACEYCQERWKLWRATGWAVRIESFLEYAQALLEERRYEEAIAEYNTAMEREPNVLNTPEGQEFFHAGAWLPLTAARSKEEDIMSYLAPSYAPETYEIAAAKPFSPFPLTIEYADGKVKGEITSAGRLVFFELMETSEEFEAGVMLVGKILQPVVMLKAWEIVRGKKQRLGTIADLFGSSEFPDVIKALRTFRVFPV